MNQPATSTILLRHGATALTGQRYSGRGDPELTDQGRAQASAAAARLATVPNIAAVISSPLRRARATAEAVAGRHRLPVQLDEDLIEADFGEFEGLSFE
ncbi:MAG: histidine phosphatase family protein, partial [Jatrophihabitans sp.]